MGRGILRMRDEGEKLEDEKRPGHDRMNSWLD